jgi:hypothetical protein
MRAFAAPVRQFTCLDKGDYGYTALQPGGHVLQRAGSVNHVQLVRNKSGNVKGWRPYSSLRFQQSSQIFLRTHDAQMGQYHLDTGGQAAAELILLPEVS